jgi:hypothetical protein
MPDPSAADLDAPASPLDPSQVSKISQAVAYVFLWSMPPEMPTEHFRNLCDAAARCAVRALNIGDAGASSVPADQAGQA